MVNTAVILAAGMGTRLRSITNNEIPKPFLEINGKSLIERSIEKLQKLGIKKIIIIVGHLKEHFNALKDKYDNIILIENKNYSTTGSMASFYCAKNLINEDILLLEGDLIYELLGLEKLLKCKEKDVLLLSEDKKNSDDYYCEILEDRITPILKKELIGNEKNIGELTGITKISKELYEEMCLLFQRKKDLKLGYEYCMAELAENRKISYILIDGLLWSEIDDEYQLNRVIKLVYPKLINKGEI